MVGTWKRSEVRILRYTGQRRGCLNWVVGKVRREGLELSVGSVISMRNDGGGVVCLEVKRCLINTGCVRSVVSI